jgi:hypothetical protein
MHEDVGKQMIWIDYNFKQWILIQFISIITFNVLGLKITKGSHCQSEHKYKTQHLFNNFSLHLINSPERNFCVCVCFEKGFHYVVHVDFKLVILLPQPPKCWDYKRVASHEFTCTLFHILFLKLKIHVYSHIFTIRV